MKLLVRGLFLFAMTAAYLYLPVLGWGGFEAYFSQPTFTALTVVTFALAGASLFAGGSVSAGVREDRKNRWVLPVLFVLGLLSGWLPAYTDRINFWTIDGEAFRWIGVLLAAAGGALRLWPVFIHDFRFSGLVAIQKGHTLITAGPYSVIRHPSYLGLLIFSVGWALVFRSGIGLALVALTIPVLLARIRAEEALLKSEFGAEYEVYRGRTARLIPGIF